MAKPTNETVIQVMIDKLTAWREREEEVQNNDCTDKRSEIADERISALDDAIAALETVMDAMAPIAER